MSWDEKSPDRNWTQNNLQEEFNLLPLIQELTCHRSSHESEQLAPHIQTWDASSSCFFILFYLQSISSRNPLLVSPEFIPYYCSLVPPCPPFHSFPPHALTRPCLSSTWLGKQLPRCNTLQQCHHSCERAQAVGMLHSSRLVFDMQSTKPGRLNLKTWHSFFFFCP